MINFNKVAKLSILVSRIAISIHKFSLSKQKFLLIDFSFSSKSFSTYCKKMSVFKFSDYDCIGFDLDHTILRYNIRNLVLLEYELLSKYLVSKKGYSPKYLLKPLSDKDLDFMQKGLVFDFHRGNILRLNVDGKIVRACHGTKLLSTSDINEIYPKQRWEVTDAFCNDMLSTWNGPLSMEMRSSLDYFDLPSSIIFARIVDTLDEEHGKPLNRYNIWPDMLEGLIDMFSSTQFALNEGGFFSSLQENPEKYLYTCSEETISWIQEAKKSKKTFLITGSQADFADFTATYALGKDWASLFDMIICFAKKPGFFTSDRPFLEVVDYKECDVVKCEDLQQGKIYSQGNWKGLLEFMLKISQKKDLQCLYIGDNLVQDIFVPNKYANCDTVAVIEEQMSEGMLHQGLTHPDEKFLNSTLWGSYFCLTGSEESSDSLWGSIIQNNSKLCIPQIDLITKHSLDKPYVSFQKHGQKYCGYYPAVPLSVACLK